MPKSLLNIVTVMISVSIIWQHIITIDIMQILFAFKHLKT